MTTVESNAIAATVEARVTTLWHQRQADRHSRYAALHSPARHDREVELRALVALLRSARRLARGMAEPITSSKAYRDLGYHDAQAVYGEPGPITEAELWGGYAGRDLDDLNLEGQPEFNGAFR